MKQKRKILGIFFLLGFCLAAVKGQQAIPATGGTAIGTGGSASYSAGQILYSIISGANGSVVQGVQQPYEISVVTAIENTDANNLECSVYPNPTSGLARLIFKSPDFEKLRFRLYDIKGDILQDKKVESTETEIYLDHLASSVYFLKVYQDGIEIKVFKIVKK
jgi:hypothetical protein